MDAVEHLLEEIQRMQCLIYLARQEDQTTPVHDLMEALRAAPGPCRTLVERLADEGLVGLTPSTAHPLPRAVRLTARGRVRVQEWKADARAEGVPAGACSTRARSALNTTAMQPQDQQERRW